MVIVVTNFEKMQKMNIEELARFVSSGKYPDLPHAPCYVCEYDEGMNCCKPGICTEEFKIEIYKDWLSAEYGEF